MRGITGLSRLGSVAFACACAFAFVGTFTFASPHARAQSKGRDQVRPERTEKSSETTDAMPPSFANALRLARMINDDRTVAMLLARYGLTKNAATADIQAVVGAYETAGKPEAAAKFLRERITLYPTEPRSRPMLAALHSRSGDTAKAVAVWREQIEKLGVTSLSLEDSHAFARDLSRGGDVDGAYAELQRMRPKATPDAKEYWSDLAMLAWERDDDATALVAYETVYKADPKTPHAGARYVALLADAGRKDEAVKVALGEHRRTGDVTFVLFAANLRVAKEDWKGVSEVLDAADKTKSEDVSVAQQEELLLLRAESRKHLGDLRGAAEAYRRALVVVPDSAATKANLLYTLLELGEVEQVRKLTNAWLPGAHAQPLLWAPLATACARLGMYDRALPLLALQIRERPQDGRILLETAEALGHVGQRSLETELRRRAVIRLRSDAVKSLRVAKPTADDLHVLESTALVVRERSGPVLAEWWLRSMRASNPSFKGQEELAADWYLSTDRPEHARRILFRKHSNPALRKYRLALALADEDHAEAQLLLDAAGADIPPEERMQGRLMLGQDRLAVAEMGPDGDGPVSADRSSARAEIDAVASQHKPNVRVGAAYIHVTGLDTYGPTLSASHDAFGGRVIYGAAGTRMTDRSDHLRFPSSGIDEAEATVLFRRTTGRAVTELGAGATYQEPDGLPVARAQFFDQRLVTSRFGITTDVRFGSPIYDTSFLRAFGVRNSAGVGARYDEARWYASADVALREDQSRHYKYLGWDALGVAEAGYKILTSEPHLSVGVQAEASVRQNRDDLPPHLRDALNPRYERVRALPPSFYLTGAVLHLSRGDYLERYRPDRAPFPRYDCELAIGALFPDTDTAIHALCGASIRAPGGYASLLAFYNRGIAGVRNNENAELTASYTIPF